MEAILSGAFALMDRLLPFAFAEPAFMKRALLALLLTAPPAAALGVPLVQHRMAFFSDAIGHSAFTGVALGVLLGISPSWTMIGFGVLVAVDRRRAIVGMAIALIQYSERMKGATNAKATSSTKPTTRVPG